MENHSYINSQFVSYEIAKKLKELGFNEVCIAHYMNELSWQIDCTEGSMYFKYSPSDEESEYSILAPLWQQAIDWLMKNGLSIQFKYYVMESYSFCIFRTNQKFKGIKDVFDRNIYDGVEGYYIAREKGILKAIEICKEFIR